MADDVVLDDGHCEPPRRAKHRKDRDAEPKSETRKQNPKSENGEAVPVLPLICVGTVWRVAQVSDVADGGIRTLI